MRTGIKHRGLTMAKRNKLIGFALFSPFLIGFVVFYVAPFLLSVVYSFTKGVVEFTFVGFDNYIEVFESPAFQIAATNTFKFLLIGVPLIMVLSILLALVLHRAFRGVSWYRSIFLLPLVIPVASAVMAFQVFFAYSGVVNTWFQQIGLVPVNWLDSDMAFSLLIGLYIWKNVGYNIILLLAGLNGIPDELYEVSRLEGATRFQTLRYVTLPLLMPTMFFVVIISIINSFKSFREAFLLSGTLPHTSIYLLQHFMNNNFENLNYQRLSVAAFLTFLVIISLVCVYFFARKKFFEYEM